MWIAMDAPQDMSAAEIIAAKVKLLKCIKTIRLSPTTCFLGQFGPSAKGSGYLDDDTVPKDSRCPTFASLLLQVDNTRWRGVPFLMTAGKGVDERLCEVPILPIVEGAGEWSGSARRARRRNGKGRE